MPAGAVVRSVGVQHGHVMVWADVDVTAAMKPRRIRVYGTGHPVPAGATFIGTAFNGPFVWHVFDETEIGA